MNAKSTPNLPKIEQISTPNHGKSCQHANWNEDATKISEKLLNFAASIAKNAIFARLRGGKRRGIKNFLKVWAQNILYVCSCSLFRVQRLSKLNCLPSVKDQSYKVTKILFRTFNLNQLTLLAAL